ncbi:Pyrroline-5-carboxylate reductase [Galdieria sulphuraria]|uniref:Pyrroline-5-carboxylate reductase n=1 Tax=Galdieria sulphuraria TaxID=130081 RepID=M2W0N1_GALSU|nr:pyrroline-5-carboxylate reductase [Galdieria sulphuraria]EME29171.1 pyrroline-5-carboxylate reductase [Galdieria sulphuraria]GJD11456.1 Pyrroline-5-carboxylate reductase [Galdieria sulphuraria]|eukprot:XP_005705691.1 pyrroline-5-carboxylate reductase [Galdieria sulphuraria]
MDCLLFEEKRERERDINFVGGRMVLVACFTGTAFRHLPWLVPHNRKDIFDSKKKRTVSICSARLQDNFTERLGFIGCGHMAGAIIRGFIAAGIPGDLIHATTRTQLSADNAKQLGVGHISSDNRHLVESCDMIFLAVKPQSLDPVLRQLRESVNSEVLYQKLFVSIAAGKTCEQIASQLGESNRVRVLRVMPNLPVAVGHVAGAYCADRHVDPKDIDRVVKLFSLVGQLEQVDENCMEAVTALCGSGPAFVYMFLEALADGAVRQGLNRKVANRLALEMVYGASKLAKKDDLHFAQLRNQVESPAGTTVYGTAALESGHFRTAIIHAIQEAVQRAKQL